MGSASTYGATCVAGAQSWLKVLCLYFSVESLLPYQNKGNKTIKSIVKLSFIKHQLLVTKN